MSFKIGDIVNIDIKGLVCCDECMEVINNYIDCPVCGNNSADVVNNYDLDDSIHVECSKCNTVYERIEDDSWYWVEQAKIVKFRKI